MMKRKNGQDDANSYSSTFDIRLNAKSDEKGQRIALHKDDSNNEMQIDYSICDIYSSDFKLYISSVDAVLYVSYTQTQTLHMASGLSIYFALFSLFLSFFLSLSCS